jgi:hypothetical protein
LFAKQQQAAGCGEHEHGADQGFLKPGPTLVGGTEQAGTKQGGDGGSHLHAEAMLVHAEELGEDHAECRDLRDCQVNEDDAAREHPCTQRHMRGEHDQTSQAGRAENAGLEALPVHLSAPSRRSMVES